ncbi:hypothetical protein [Bombilactobacillus bombi]|uniref:hypothetical protein n=1 Tax=Bombilactobacillus bombi TaxID=1303590 RepID=UPI0015E5FD48|nr:hypothetical protein [Bombilactobacillus bombi]MBA1434293.1 hypothetical protein [Bombilactobacillus bombi]
MKKNIVNIVYWVILFIGAFLILISQILASNIRTCQLNLSKTIIHCMQATGTTIIIANIIIFLNTILFNNLFLINRKHNKAGL